MSDLSQAPATEDPELQRFALELWASDRYRSWRDRALRAVADGTILREPSLDDDAGAPEA